MKTEALLGKNGRANGGWSSNQQSIDVGALADIAALKTNRAAYRKSESSQSDVWNFSVWFAGWTIGLGALAAAISFLEFSVIQIAQLGIAVVSGLFIAAILAEAIGGLIDFPKPHAQTALQTRIAKLILIVCWVVSTGAVNWVIESRAQGLF